MSRTMLVVLAASAVLLFTHACGPDKLQDGTPTQGRVDTDSLLSILRATDATIVVAVDDMVCSSCVKDLVFGINSSCETSIVIVSSEGNDVMVKKWLTRRDIAVLVQTSETIQRTFPSEYSLTINEWKGNRYVQIADVNSSNSESYGKYLAETGCTE